MKIIALMAVLLAVATQSAAGAEPAAALPEWAFQPLSDSRPPLGRASDAVATPVDTFIVEKLHAAGLELSPPADRATFIRRLSLDLLGLPPAPADVDAFVADRSPTAAEDLVDRLLASPHFGERWGRHWLDSVGYADTVGFDVDATLIITSEGKWRYRDWVINALNADKPYDRFVTEQLAGDELVPWRTAEHYTPEIIDSLVATGYLRTARDYTHEPESTIPLNYFELLHDTLEIVGSSLLGITLNCARCHDHKFDPLTQQDYYGVMACLTPAYNPTAWRVVTPYKNRDDDRTLADVSLPEKAAIDEHNTRLDKEVAAARERMSSVRGAGRSRLFDQRLTGVPEQIRADVRAALDASEKSRTEVQRYLADRFKDLAKISDDDVKATLTADEQLAIRDAESAIAAAEKQRRRYGKIQALYDVGSPPATHLLTSGDYLLPAEEVAPAFLQILSPGNSTSIAVTDAPAGSSGRRLAFARRLTQPDTPASGLLARVYVNRVWQHLFGEGLVATSENFGAQGSTPTHPELLDWLSRRFIADGWRTKSLIRLVVMSQVYQQPSSSAGATAGSSSGAGALAVDPQNHLLWRMRLRRLESEIVRDSVRFASGTLSDTMGGPPVLIKAGVDGAVVVDPEKLASPDDASRRSVYLLTRRAYNESLLTVFDQPLISTTCQRRDASAVPLQSLTMLNSDLLLEQSAKFAERVAALAGTDADAQITTAYRLLLCRAPDPEEIALCRQHLRSQAARFTEAGQADAAARCRPCSNCVTRC
ncbi:MAG: DUF1553 domain-containing protein [Planctomycetaceae bacterium]